MDSPQAHRRHLARGGSRHELRSPARSASCICGCTRPIRCSKGALPIKTLGEARRRRPHAGARHRRHRQSVRRARIRREDGREGHPADHRLPGRARFRRRAARAAGRARRAQKPLADIVLIAATEAGYWNLVRLVSDSFMETEPGDRAHVAVAALAGATDGLIALTGGPGGPIDRAIAAGQGDLAAARLERLAGALRRPALCRAAAPRHGGRGGGRAASRRSRLAPRPAAGRDQRAVLPGARRLRGARRADRHRRGRGDRRRQPPAADAGALFQVARRDGGAVRRPARGDSKTRSRSPCAAACWPRVAEADPAALRRGRRRCRRRPTRPRRRCCAQAAEAGLDRAARRARPRARPEPRTTTASASTSSSASSSG